MKLIHTLTLKGKRTSKYKWALVGQDFQENAFYLTDQIDKVCKICYLSCLLGNSSCIILPLFVWIPFSIILLLLQNKEPVTEIGFFFHLTRAATTDTCYL